MGIQNIKITFDNTNQTYFPGQIVTGNVQIDLTSVNKFNDIFITFKGRAKTHWSRRSGKSTSHYHGNQIYFNDLSYLIGGNSTPIELPSGTHVYPFAFAIPLEIPSSFEGKKGDVKYSVKVILNRPWKFDKVMKQEFLVLVPINLNEIEIVKKPVALTMQREFCVCCKMGQIKSVVKLPCSGFVCGQIISLIIEIENESNVNVQGVLIELKKYVTFFTTNRKSSIQKKESLLKEYNNITVRARKSEVTVHNIRIPDIPSCNLTKCNIIDINYKIKFKIKLSGFHTDIPGVLPVVIGTIPLNYITPIEHISSVLNIPDTPDQ